MFPADKDKTNFYGVKAVKVYKNLDLYGKKVDIAVLDGVIKKVGKTEESGIDCTGLSVYPGLFDIHIHGCGGYDTMDEGALPHISHIEAQHGTTSFLPTTMTAPMENIRKIVNQPIKYYGGAKIWGFHLEGPYISPKYKGAQNEKYIKVPDIKEFSALKNIKMVTIAPELNASAEFIKNCKAVVSLGHTDADYNAALKAIENGAKCLTHTFNAMPPLHHRNPGPIGAAIEKNIYVQVICDGLHIHKSVIWGLYKIFGADRMILISDSMRAAGLYGGEYEFGGQNITVKNSVARTADGAIAGSTSFLWDCVRKAVEFGIPKEDAVSMATRTPAALMGVKTGEVKAGYDADLIFADDDMNIKSVFARGKEIKPD